VAVHRDLVESGFDLKRLGLDFESQAFAPREVPATNEGAYPTELTIKDRYLSRRVPPSADADAATLYLRYFDEAAQRRPAETRPAAAAAAAIPLAGLSSQSLTAAIDVGLHMTEFGLFIPFLDPAPPEAALLAIRAARRALAHDANDANA